MSQTGVMQPGEPVDLGIFVDEKIMTLRKPVKLGDVTYETLELREPTAGEIAQSERGSSSNADMLITLIGLVAKVPRKAAEALCKRDFDEAGEFLSGF